MWKAVEIGPVDPRGGKAEGWDPVRANEVSVQEKGIKLVSIRGYANFRVEAGSNTSTVAL
jgi:hypothetical protein